ncbi:hypothetical protein [Desulfurobacterium sp.]|nr:hypothetical protein [Desulfurobacterium sp.]
MCTTAFEDVVVKILKESDLPTQTETGDNLEQVAVAILKEEDG